MILSKVHHCTLLGSLLIDADPCSLGRPWKNSSFRDKLIHHNDSWQPQRNTECSHDTLSHGGDNVSYLLCINNLSQCNFKLKTNTCPQSWSVEPFIKCCTIIPTVRIKTKTWKKKWQKDKNRFSLKATKYQKWCQWFSCQLTWNNFSVAENWMHQQGRVNFCFGKAIKCLILSWSDPKKDIFYAM